MNSLFGFIFFFKYFIKSIFIAFLFFISIANSYAIDNKQNKLTLFGIAYCSPFTDGDKCYDQKERFNFYGKAVTGPASYFVQSRAYSTIDFGYGLGIEYFNNKFYAAFEIGGDHYLLIPNMIHSAQIKFMAGIADEFFSIPTKIYGMAIVNLGKLVIYKYDPQNHLKESFSWTVLFGPGIAFKPWKSIQHLEIGLELTAGITQLPGVSNDVIPVFNPNFFLKFLF